MDRKAIARQTLDIMEKGWYETEELWWKSEPASRSQ